MPMIDPDLSRRAGNSQPEYNTHTPGRHWPGVFVRMAPSACPIFSPSSPIGGRVRKDGIMA